MPIGEMAFDLGDEFLCLSEDATVDLRRQILIGKIDRRFEMGENSGQAIAPAVIEAAEFAVELAQRLATLRLRLGRGKIGDGLGLQQIELAVDKGAAGEFAGLGESQPEAAQRLRHSGEHGATAVHMKLGNILSRRAPRRREP